jgi:hypothetical protein
MTSALGSHGTLLKIGDGGTPTESFASIAELADITAPPLSRTMHEARSQTQPWVERVAGMLDAGECTMALNFIPTDSTHNDDTGLIADLVAGTLRNFQLWFPDSGPKKWGFAAYISAVQATAPVDGLLTADVTLTISGAVNFDAT